MKNVFLLIFFSICSCVYAQEETNVSGRILEKGTNNALPFVSIGFKGTKTGTTSDFEGNFSLKTSSPSDTLIFSYVGYKVEKRKIKAGQKQHIIIEMQSQSNDLREFVVHPGENPALKIIRKAQQKRAVNNQENLSEYEFDSYNKVDVSMNNISEKMKNSLVFKPLKKLLDTTSQMKNEEGKYILPLFISESYSRYFQTTSPSQNKEIVKGSSINGIGVNQGSYVIDLLGATTMQFNFCNNWLRILGKDFISPIASGSMNYYIYTLTDSLWIDGLKCYKIKLNLRREEDLGFLGTIWITDSTFAIKRIDVELSPNANVNFVDRMKIQQEMQQTKAGPWLPVKVRMVFDVAELTKNSSGFIAKLYRSNSSFEVNQKKEDHFFSNTFERNIEASEQDSSFWKNVRKEPFSKVETQMFNMIDSVKNVPVVKTYTDIIRLILDGYYRIGKFDYGPYVFLLGYNYVEHLRFQLGLKTNQYFSENYQLNGHVAYGTFDEKIKYSVGGNYILSRKHWTTIGGSFKDDYDILGVTDNSGSFIQRSPTSNVFAAFSFFSPKARINRTIDYRINFVTQPINDWTFHAFIQNTTFEPKFNFAYKNNPDGTDSLTNLSHNFIYTAATFEVRYAYKELMVVRGVERTRLTRAKAPILTLSYTHGFKGILNGQYDFDKVQLNVRQHISTGFLGNADYNFTVGKIFGTLPYPMLYVPAGNQTFFYSDYNFSLMNLYEFVADQFVYASYVQHFEGLFFNRIPVLNKWKLRNFALIKATYGSLTEDNISIIPLRNRQGKLIEPVTFFGNQPYVEVGYGIENIFKFFTIGAYHRLTYIDPSRKMRTFGINVGLRFTF
jgi:Family of unknown function (DUF5686)/CarboxypepD_reg-like domain